MHLVTKAIAIENGLARYYEGVPCENGHDSGRWTRSGACVGCLAGRRHKYRARIAPNRLKFEITVPSTLDNEARLALIDYLQFVCVPTFLKSRG